jgi:hypothetical protein
MALLMVKFFRLNAVALCFAESELLPVATWMASSSYDDDDDACNSSQM